MLGKKEQNNCRKNVEEVDKIIKVGEESEFVLPKSWW